MCAHICDWKGSGERDMSHLCSSFTFYHMFKEELCFLCMHFTLRQMKNLNWRWTKLIAAYRSATINNNTNLLTSQDSDTNSNTCVSSPHQASVASLDGNRTSASASPERAGAAMGGARLQRGRLRSVTARHGALPRLGPLYGHLESPADGRFRKRIDKDQRVENAMSRKEGAACWRPGTTQPQFLIVFRRKVS